MNIKQSTCDYIMLFLAIGLGMFLCWLVQGISWLWGKMDYIIVGFLLVGSVCLGFKIFWFLRLMLW